MLPLTTVVDVCGQSDPCENGGSCSNDGTGGYSCLCPNQYTGVNCEIDINEGTPSVSEGTSEGTLGGLSEVTLAGNTGSSSEFPNTGTMTPIANGEIIYPILSMNLIVFFGFDF